MNLSQLYYFRKLAELQHYGKAAEQLFITQPSLSNAISNLEKELGVSLFERVGRNIRLTNYGREFNEHICKALDEVDKAVDLMKLYGSGLSGPLRAGTVISIQRNYLPTVMHAFRMEYGDDVDFDIHQGTTYQLIDSLKNGDIDVAFCGKLADERGIHFEPMLTQNLVVGVDRSHPLAQKDHVSMYELRNYPVVSYRPESFASTILEGLFSRFGITAKPAFNDEISAGTLLSAEKDVCAVILETLDRDTFRSLAYLSIDEVRDPFHIIYLAYKENGNMSIIAEKFIEFARVWSNFPVGAPTLEQAFWRDPMRYSV